MQNTPNAQADNKAQRTMQQPHVTNKQMRTQSLHKEMHRDTRCANRHGRHWHKMPRPPPLGATHRAPRRASTTLARADTGIRAKGTPCTFRCAHRFHIRHQLLTKPTHERRNAWCAAPAVWIPCVPLYTFEDSPAPMDQTGLQI